MTDITSVYASVTEAVYDFLSAYLSPAVDPQNIILGDQNNMTLPAGTEDYVIFYVTGMERHGTTVEDYDTANETLILRESSELTVRVDCYGNSANGQNGMNAQLRAHNLELVARSSVAPRFFKSYGMSLLYADPAVDTTVPQDESYQFLRRWMVILHLHLTNALELSQEGFTALKFKALNSIITKDQASEETAGIHLTNIDVKIKATD